MKRYWQYNWWKYVAVILLPIILWTTLFDILKQPAPEERLRILYIGESLNTAALEEELAAWLPDHTAQKLKEISVNTEQRCDTTLLTARCFEYDIIIIENPHLPQNVGRQVFSSLSEHRQFPNAALYYEEEIPCGYLLEAETSTGFSAHYAGQNTCCLFFSPESVNCDPEAGTDAALQAAKYLLENIT